MHALVPGNRRAAAVRVRSRRDAVSVTAGPDKPRSQRQGDDARGFHHSEARERARSTRKLGARAAALPWHCPLPAARPVVRSDGWIGVVVGTPLCTGREPNGEPLATHV